MDFKSELFEALMQAASERLLPNEVAFLRSVRDMMTEKALLLPSAVEGLSLEELINNGCTPGVAALLKKAFPSKSSIFNWFRSHPCSSYIVVLLAAAFTGTSTLCHCSCRIRVCHGMPSVTP